MFSRGKKVNKEANTYAGVILHLSAKTADELKKELAYSEETSTVMMVQTITFCIINLMHTFGREGISVERGREAIELILREVAKMLAPNQNEIEETYRTLNTTVHGWIKDYARLPPGEKLSNQAGTLIWEYGKLMTSTAGKDPESDIHTVLLVGARAVNVNNALETNGLVKALK